MIVLALIALLARPIVFVPLDDRPVTLQLPVMLGEIAGRRVVTPPRKMLGNYIHPGEPDAIVKWLGGSAPPDASALVASSDMLAYGGLVASRVPGTPYDAAYFRLRAFGAFKHRDPHAWTAAFGTVMRLAPTGIPPIEDATNFFAAYPVWSYLQQYANLHDPPTAGEEPAAQRLREQIGDATLRAYLETRARNYAVDALLIAQTRQGAIDRLVLGQDDAGRVGLHVKDVRALQQLADDAQLGERASIEPGADELGMALVAQALARGVAWTPHVAVHYSTPEGANYQDPLEYAPISVAIEQLIALCGSVRDDEHPDVVLYVRVPRTPPLLDDALVTAMQQDAQAGRSVAFADLSFEESYAMQGDFAQRLLASGLARNLDAYSSWNTNANTVGTALAEAIAAGSGRRSKTYNALAHKTFTIMRLVDDDAYHVDARPRLNAWLDAHGVGDHTYLPASVVADAQEQGRRLLWPSVQATVDRLAPGYHIAVLRISLPWRRTFETQIEIRLAPTL